MKSWQCGILLLCSFIAVSSVATEYKSHLASSSDRSTFVNRILVGPNVQVSKERGNDAHYETLLAADAKNPNNLLGGSMAFSAEKNKWLLVAYASFDGGRTWRETLAIDEPNTCCDPAVAFGPDGTAYFAHFGPTAEMKYYTYVYRSKDGGKTWLPRIQLPFMDRDYLVVDDTNGKYHGRIYVHGVTVTKTVDGGFGSTALTAYSSTDGGASFGSPTQLISAGDNFILGHAPGAVLSDGTLAYLFGELQHARIDPKVPPSEERPAKPNAFLKLITSEDGGETFSKAAIIADYALPRTSTTSIMPCLAADRSGGPFNDRLYAAFSYVTSGRVEISLAFSADKGKSWSKPIAVNDKHPSVYATNGPDNFMPVVAVNKNGVVGVMWYDRGESSNNLDWRPRFTASLDGGETFLPSVPVSESPFTYGKDEKWVIRARGSGSGNSGSEPGPGNAPFVLQLDFPWFHFKGGDTAGLAADANGIFHAFWVDNRSGISQVWTAPITIQGKSVRNGSAELAALDDISSKLVINYSKANYNRSTNTVSVDAELENISEETITGPIKVRVISLKSDVGIPRVLTIDSGEGGIRAVWDFTPLLSDNKLGPKQKSGVKHLEFTLSNLQPFEQVRPFRDDSLFPFIRVEVRVLGTAEKKSVIR